MKFWSELLKLLVAAFGCFQLSKTFECVVRYLEVSAKYSFGVPTTKRKYSTSFRFPHPRIHVSISFFRLSHSPVLAFRFSFMNVVSPSFPCFSFFTFSRFYSRSHWQQLITWKKLQQKAMVPDRGWVITIIMASVCRAAHEVASQLWEERRATQRSETFWIWPALVGERMVATL